MFIFRFVTHWMSKKERAEKMGNQPKKFTNVYIKNFGEEMTEDMLKDLCGEAGKVVSLKIMTDDGGKGKGFGFISFENPDEAEKVCVKHKSHIDILIPKVYTDGKSRH